MNIGTDLISLLYTVFALAVIPFILRFLLQASKADFYNPISQFIVKFTNPFASPIRKILPNTHNFDFASLMCAYIIQAGLIAILLISLTFPVDISIILSWAALSLLKTVFNLYFVGLIIVVIASWVAPNSYNPSLILINQLLEPVIAPIRRIMPDLGGIDLSPIVLFLGLKLLDIVIISPLAVLTKLSAYPGLLNLIL